jgi:hypothetical protein
MRGRNEAIDTTVLALFVFEALNVAKFDERQWMQLERKAAEPDLFASRASECGKPQPAAQIPARRPRGDRSSRAHSQTETTEPAKKPADMKPSAPPPAQPIRKAAMAGAPMKGTTCKLRREQCKGRRHGDAAAGELPEGLQQEIGLRPEFASDGASLTWPTCAGASARRRSTFPRHRAPSAMRRSTANSTARTPPRCAQRHNIGRTRLYRDRRRAARAGEGGSVRFLP